MILGARACGSASVLVAESLAVKEGIKVALFMGCKRLEIEGDNLCVINSVRGV